MTLQNFLEKNKEFNVLFNALSKHNQKLYVVGGAVRNSLIGQDITDIDLSSSCTPSENLTILKESGIKTLTHGIEFGTVVAIINGKSFEITSFRKDFKQTGRYTKVVFTKNLELDAKRRDFTYNALYYCPKSKTIYDFFNGIEHLKKGQTIFIGNAQQRIREDFLRILRYFRFTSIYGNGTFTESIVKVCQQENKGLKILSKERISEELVKIFTSPYVANTLNALSNHKILEHVLKLDFCETKKEQLENILTYFKNQGFETYSQKLFVMLFLQLSSSFNVLQLVITSKLAKSIKETVYIFNNLTESTTKEQIYLMLEKNDRNNIINALALKAYFTKNNEFLTVSKNLPAKLNFPFNGSVFTNKIKKDNIKNALYSLKITYLNGTYTANTILEIIKKYKD